MTEPDNEPVFDPATDADAPAEEAVSDTTTEASEDPSVAVLLETTPEDPVEPTPEPESPIANPEPVEVSSDAPELDAAPVSGAVSDPSAVSDDENAIQPDYAEVPVDTKAEPKNAEVSHEAASEQVEAQE